MTQLHLAKGHIDSFVVRSRPGVVSASRYICLLAPLRARLAAELIFLFLEGELLARDLIGSAGNADYGSAVVSSLSGQQQHDNTCPDQQYSADLRGGYLFPENEQSHQKGEDQFDLSERAYISSILQSKGTKPTD